MSALHGPWHVTDRLDEPFALVDAEGRVRGVLYDLDAATLCAAAPDLLRVCQASQALTIAMNPCTHCTEARTCDDHQNRLARHFIEQERAIQQATEP